MKNRATVALAWDPRSIREMDQTVQNAFKDASEQLGDAGKKAAKLLAAAVGAGAKSNAAAFTKLINDHTKKLIEAQKKVEALKEEQAQIEADFQNASQQKLTAAQKQALMEQRKSALSALEDKIKKEKRAAENLQVKAIRAFERSSAKEVRVAEEHAKILAAAHEGASKLLRERLQEGGELFASAVSSGLSLSMDTFKDGILKGISTAATKIPQMAARINESRADKGSKPSMILDVLTKVGPVLLGVGAALGGIAALFTAVYSQTLDFNKAILDGTSALDIFGARALNASFDMKKGLRTIREAAVDVAIVTGQTTENVISSIMAYNRTGVSLKTLQGQFSKTGEAMEAYTEMAYFASSYTKTFGASVDEITGAYGELFTNAGLGLDSIKNGFQAIATAAIASGMNVKDFFTTVSQATAGLALYNLRAEDTSKQLLGLTKILGKEKAKEMINAEGQLGNADYGEKYRSGMLVKERGQKIFKGSFERQSQSFEKDARAALGDAYDTIVDDLMSNSKRLASLSGEKLGQLEQKISKAAGGGVQGEALARRLRNVRRAAIGAQGGAANMATGMSGLGPMEDLAMRIQKGMSLIGQQSLDAMRSLPERKFFEEQSGISGRQFDELAAILNRIKAAGPEGMTDAEALTKLAQGEIPLSEEDQKALEDMKPPESIEKLAQKQIEETTNINDTLKNLIAKLLEGLTEALDAILNGLASWMPDSFGKEKRARAELLETREHISTRKKDIKTKEDQLKELTGQVSVLPEGPAKDLAQQQLDALQANIDTEKARLAFDEKVEKANKAGLSGTDAAAAATGVSTVTKRDTVIFGNNATVVNDKTEEQLLAETEAAKELQIKDAADRSAAERKTARTDKEQQATLEKIEKSAERQSAIEALGAITGDPASVALAKQGDRAAIEKLRAFLQSHPEAAGLFSAGGVQLEDFIYRGDGTRGTINPINKKDEFFGAKPGGAIDKAINGGGGGGVVNINIYGGDENKVYQVVKRVLQESGRV